MARLRELRRLHGAAEERLRRAPGRRTAATLQQRAQFADALVGPRPNCFSGRANIGFETLCNSTPIAGCSWVSA